MNLIFLINIFQSFIYNENYKTYFKILVICYLCLMSSILCSDYIIFYISKVIIL